MSKRWTYKQITDATEKDLRGYAALAAQRPNDRGMADVYHCMANGALAMWRDLTLGWQADGDRERLAALADAVGKPEKPAPTGESES